MTEKTVTPTPEPRKSKRLRHGKNLEGQVFNRLTVLRKESSSKQGVIWRCKCTCGNETTVLRSNLTGNRIKSCGCMGPEAARRNLKKATNPNPVIDLTGERFDRLLVIERAENCPKGGARWRCKCDCGKITIVPSRTLIHGGTKSCGCGQFRGMKRHRDDLTGQKFGRLTALSFVRSDPEKGRTFWRCLCDCGKETRVNAHSLKTGMTKSCGCLHDEVRRTKGKKYTRSDEPRLYTLGGTLGNYKHSAARKGIDWALSAAEFERLIKKPCSYCGAKPSKKCNKRGKIFLRNGIDRINSSKGYEKSNVTPCCFVCNVAKSTHRASDFTNWISRAFLHLTATGQIPIPKEFEPTAFFEF